MPTDNARNRSDVTAHSPTLFTRKVADRSVGQSAISRDRDHGNQDPDHRQIEAWKETSLSPARSNVFHFRLVRTFPVVLLPVTVQVFISQHRKVAEFEESRTDFCPCVQPRIKQREEHQKTHHNDQLERHDRFQGIVDLAADRERKQQQDEQHA